MRQKYVEANCTLLMHRAEINSTSFSLRVCVSFARFPIDIFFLPNVMATLK